MENLTFCAVLRKEKRLHNFIAFAILHKKTEDFVELALFLLLQKCIPDFYNQLR